MATQVSPLSLNVLLRRLGADNAQWDYEENRARTGYEQARSDFEADQGQNQKRLDAGLSDRGLGDSGIAAQENLNFQRGANSARQKASQALTDTLTNIARKRLESGFAFDETRLGLR